MSEKAQDLAYPLPPGRYVLYDVKERRGWWAGNGHYSIWPGRAKCYTAEEVNAMIERGGGPYPYVEIGRAQDLALSCLDFVSSHTLSGS